MVTAVDLFAGAGGFSTGAIQAGLRVLWAANHWRAAVDIHAANHPGAQHACQDLQQADWSAVPRHDVLLASPACQGHSRARGVDRPHHDAMRSTAWAVVEALEVHRSAVAVIENVPEFTGWVLYPAWCQAMAALGYALAPHVIDAADHGVPQNRVRLYLVASRSSAPLVLRLPKQEHTPAMRIIEDMPARSALLGKAQATRARAAAGRRAHGDRFLIAYYGNEKGGRSLNRPLGTVTTRERWALVDGENMRMLTVNEYRDAMGFPSDYQLPAGKREAVHMLGNAVCPPVAANILREIRRVA